MEMCKNDGKESRGKKDENRDLDGLVYFYQPKSRSTKSTDHQYDK